VDKKLAAEKIRARLQKRLATFLGCEMGNLSRLRLGELAHTMFLLHGDEETMGGFSPTMHAMTQILGREILWELPKVEEVETPKPEEKVAVN
jgi:hypothetical protein